MADSDFGGEAEFRGTFVIAAVNSAEGFLQRVAVAKTREQALEALEGAVQWIERAKRTIEHGELPEGFGTPAVRPAGPRLPLERLDIDDDGA